MKEEERKAIQHGYEYYDDDVNWTEGIGRPAGVFWLDGESRIAAHGSRAEAALLARGAALVATLLFGEDYREGRRNGARVEHLAARRASALHTPAVN